MTSSSRVGAIVVVLSTIRHDGGVVIDKLNGVVRLDACTRELYASVNGWKNGSQMV